MTRLSFTILLGLAVTAAVAMQLESTAASGATSGYLLGASGALAGVLCQRRVMARRPEMGLYAGVVAFLVKLVVVVVLALVLRFVDPLAARVDWRAFLVAFAGAVAVILPLGTLDAVRVLKEKEAH